MSTLKVTNIQATGETASRAVSGVAAAWMNFADSSTATINNSFNISSITDQGTGQYTPYFTNSFNDHYYAALGSTEQGSSDLTFEIRTTATNYYDMWLSVGGSMGDNVITDASSTVTGDLA